ncbi:hypothetical protein GUITHDRAFT_105981 [Guillardia theta CCMP2712]|uniref:Uncharacterized protein n=1 Tax=Guillardia theta (strain CCMP2712) TaxID=905079 RepID=L1JIN1_GUITC|nr:hypothetical protein GUITHDRAFT_105981 [Guillardia theta CCMP2712]EKX48373.1 hypothetical protein GUITHDRAFT_105981 [Guillardia theta CCMP2712]|eukprot:XP_005835353.1 hypothetical protein GUITHDRAFT_105981 [Guillardia theta CCMP2712]
MIMMMIIIFMILNFMILVDMIIIIAIIIIIIIIITTITITMMIIFMTSSLYFLPPVPLRHAAGVRGMVAAAVLYACVRMAFMAPTVSTSALEDKLHHARCAAAATRQTGDVRAGLAMEALTAVAIVPEVTESLAAAMDLSMLPRKKQAHQEMECMWWTESQDVEYSMTISSSSSTSFTSVLTARRREWRGSKCCSQVQKQTAQLSSFFGTISARAQLGSRGFIVVNLLVLVASASGDAAAATRGAASGAGPAAVCAPEDTSARAVDMETATRRQGDAHAMETSRESLASSCRQLATALAPVQGIVPAAADGEEFATGRADDVPARGPS